MKVENRPFAQLWQFFIYSNSVQATRINPIQTSLFFVLKKPKGGGGAKTMFEYEGLFYQQIRGLAMGNRLSGTLAIICMDRLERKFVYSLKPKPIFYVRYVDDVNPGTWRGERSEDAQLSQQQASDHPVWNGIARHWRLSSDSWYQDEDWRRRESGTKTVLQSEQRIDVELHFAPSALYQERHRKERNSTRNPLLDQGTRTCNLQSPSYAQSYRKTITRKAHSNHLSPRRTSHHVLSSSHHCIFQYFSCRTNLTMVCNVFLISTRLMRVCVTLVAELSSRPRPGRAHPRPSPARVENAAHPKSATGAMSSTKLRVCYATLPTSVWPRVRSIHVPWSISPVQGNTRWSLLSGNITRTSIRRWRPPWISEFSNNAGTNFAFTSKKPWQSSVIAHNLIVVTKTWVQVFWFEVLCAVSRDHDRALVIFVLTMSQFIFIFLFNWLVTISLSHELFFPFFLFPFLPSILSLPRAASTWTWHAQRLSSLVCTCVPRSFSRHAWFFYPDFSSVFHKPTMA